MANQVFAMAPDINSAAPEVDDLFPFADSSQVAINAAKQHAELLKWIAADDEACTKCGFNPLVLRGLTSFAEDTLKPYKSDPAASATHIVNTVMAANEKQTFGDTCH